VLFAVYEALFGSEITFGGIFEYPISPEDNFDTFDNWHQEEGEWVNSLKTYAETVKTTKLVANDHGLPFQWTDSLSQQLKRQIDSACSAQRGVPGAAGCQDNYAVYVPGAQSYRFRPMPETGKHITDAMGNGGFPFPPERIQWYAPSRSVGGRAAINAGFRRNWFNTGFQPNNCTAPVPVTVCDEFPFWSTTQAVNLSGPLASLRRVPRSEALPQAQDISHFYSKCRVADAEKFMVLPVPGWVAANGPSFAFRVNQGGANMCMVPTVP
jgi:hypothetical protein